MKSSRLLNLTHLQVLDGGLATELETAGCNIDGPLWSGHVLRDQPDRIEAVHMAYLDAGSDCISTASYQVSREAFRAAGLPENEADAALQLSVELAERACTRYHQKHRRPVWVAASLGPYGASLHNGAEYTGLYDIHHAGLVAFHQRRIQALATTNADFLLFETVPSLDEANAIVTALAGAPDIAATISFNCRDDRHTAHGEDIVACAAQLESARQIVAIGINCFAPSLAIPLLRRLRQATSKKLAVYPNAGQQWDAEHRRWKDAPAAPSISSATATPDDWRTLGRQWRDAGADWIGGCCKTGPAHIRAVSAAMAG